MADQSEPLPSYRPRMPAEYWAVIEDFVTRAVRDAHHLTAYPARDLFAAAAPLALWAWQTAGLPLERDAVFALHTIERFAEHGMPTYRTRSGRNTIRSRLVRMHEVLLDKQPGEIVLRPFGRSTPSTPYSQREVVIRRSWAASQGTQVRRVAAAVLLGLGFGAGLAGAEILRLKVGDIHVDDEGVILQVHDFRPRTVPVLREWEPALIARARTGSEDEWAFRPHHARDKNTITSFVEGADGDVPLQARRIRATWVVHHLEAGTPLKLLMSTAGLSGPEALDRFLPFVRSLDRGNDRAVLRDAVAPPR